MKKKILLGLALLIGSLSIGGCQYTTKVWGGTTTVDIPAGKKLVPYTVQWEAKNSNLWYLVEDAEPGYTPKTYEFKETSNLGAAEGKVLFVEHGKE